MTRKYLTQDEVYRLMDAAQSMSFPERNRCLIMMAFIHGFRASELLDLRLSDIDASGKQLNIRRIKNGFSTTHPRWCCQLTDLVYDGVFEVLQWLLFLSAVPPVQLLTGWCVTAKAPPDISAISALTAVKHGNCSSLTPLLNPVRTRKSLIWPWMALDAGQQPALWALASTRFYVT